MDCFMSPIDLYEICGEGLGFHNISTWVAIYITNIPLNFLSFVLF